MADNCSDCGGPERTLWGPAPGHPPFRTRDAGHWIELTVCDRCQALWCSAPYEPYAAFRYSALWLHSVEDWRLIHDADQGATLRDWLTGVVHDTWRGLPPDEQVAVEKHDQRAYGHSPIRGLYRRSVDPGSALAALRDG